MSVGARDGSHQTARDHADGLRWPMPFWWRTVPAGLSSQTFAGSSTSPVSRTQHAAGTRRGRGSGGTSTRHTPIRHHRRFDARSLHSAAAARMSDSADGFITAVGASDCAAEELEVVTDLDRPNASPDVGG